MKNNKLISILLALLVCLSMVVSVSATEEANLIFALESADSSVEDLDAAVVGVGEEFVVTLDIVKNEGFKNAILYVEYDAEKLELTGVKSLDEENVKIYKNGKIYIGPANSWEAGDAYTATGSIAELTFKVKVETDEQITIALNASQKNVTNAEGKANVITVAGEALKVNAVSADHKCDANNTVEANAKEASCTEAGKKADLLCAHCGKIVTKGEEIPALDHPWESMVMKAPTCGEQGMELDTCSVCGESKVGQAIPATGEHTFGEWNVTTEPTVEAEGEKTRTCSVCGQEETEAIAKLPPVEQPAPKNNTLLIVVIVVVVLAGAGVAAYFVLKNKKK
jgi:hypothetical protein